MNVLKSLYEQTKSLNKRTLKVLIRMIFVTSWLKGTSTADGMKAVSKLSIDSHKSELVELWSKEFSNLLEGFDGFVASDDAWSWIGSSGNGFLEVILLTSGVVWRMSGLLLLWMSMFWLFGVGVLVPLTLFLGAFRRLSLDDPASSLYLHKSRSRIWYHISDGFKGKIVIRKLILLWFSRVWIIQH